MKTEFFINANYNNLLLKDNLSLNSYVLIMFYFKINWYQIENRNYLDYEFFQKIFIINNFLKKNNEKTNFIFFN